MPTFNYLTSDGKSLKVNTDSLNDESKEKIKTFIKGDLAKKESFFLSKSVIPTPAMLAKPWYKKLPLAS